METFGRYQLLRKVGIGGLAEVFLAQIGQGSMRKFLAIKRLLPAYSHNKKVVKRLIAEARLTVWLSHPNIVQVFDFGMIDESYYIAMEYVEGCDLQDVINPTGVSGSQLPIEVVLDVSYRIVDALRYAHHCTDEHGSPLGIIHRDVSPHNVLISLDGHPKLADFGVARARLPSSERTQPGAILGKYSYMAPEQARGSAYDARVDIYAAGAMIYQMLTGDKAFRDRSSQLKAGLYQLPPPPSRHRPSIPPSLDALVLKAMAPRPEDRFQDAEDLTEAVQRELTRAGLPKPHQLQMLVTEAIKARKDASDRRREDTNSKVGFEDFGDEENSLIVGEVTRVKHLILPESPAKKRGSGARPDVEPADPPDTAFDALKRRRRDKTGPPQQRTPAAPGSATPTPTPPGLPARQPDRTDDLSPEPAPAPGASEYTDLDDEITSVAATTREDIQVGKLPSVGMELRSQESTSPFVQAADFFLTPRARQLVVVGMGLAVLLMVFGTGILVGRCTVKDRPTAIDTRNAAARTRSAPAKLEPTTLPLSGRPSN